MELEAFVNHVNGFQKLSTADKMLVVGYYFNEVKKRDRFVASEINAAFDSLHLARPSNASSQLNSLTAGRPSRLLGDVKGFRLSATSRERVAAMLKLPTPKQISVELSKLEGLIVDPLQRTFLAETIICFQHGAYRAAIVMAWNLAYHHVCIHIFDNHLAEYNARLPIQAKGEKPIQAFADFEKAKESVVIAVAKGASIINKTTAKTLEAKLDIRNTAAHPSSAAVQPITAEEVITDLVHNILLKQPL